jgi:hypothetical protein
MKQRRSILTRSSPTKTVHVLKPNEDEVDTATNYASPCLACFGRLFLVKLVP